jgi:putative membrane protein
MGGPAGKTRQNLGKFMKMTGKNIGAAVLSMAAAVAMGSSRASAQAGTPKLNDAEIAHVAVTANAVDIEMGQIAEKRASSKAVKDFAATMIRDHTGVNKQAGELAAKLHVTPAGNAVSTSLRTGETASKAKLDKATGAAFDKAYMDNEIAYHQAVIDAVDKVLVPQTQNAELKALLENVRPALVAHLDHAKMVRAGLK